MAALGLRIASGLGVLALGVAAIGVQAAEVTVKVASTAMPWDLKKNPNFPIGKGDGTAPAIADLALTPGLLLRMTATGSTTTVAGGGSFDPDGQVDYVCDDKVGGSGSIFPSKFINPAFYPVHLNELVAVFTDADGRIVKSPFPIGKHMVIKVPAGAVHIQFGINDDVFADNSGEIDVTIVTPDAPQP